MKTALAIKTLETMAIRAEKTARYLEVKGFSLREMAAKLRGADEAWLDEVFGVSHGTKRTD